MGSWEGNSSLLGGCGYQSQDPMCLVYDVLEIVSIHFVQHCFISFLLTLTHGVRVCC